MTQLSSKSALCLKAATNLGPEDTARFVELFDTYSAAGLGQSPAAQKAASDLVAEIRSEGEALLQSVGALTTKPVEHPAGKALRAKSHPASVRGSVPLAEISRALGGLSPDLLPDLSQKVNRTRTSRLGSKTQYVVWDNPPVPGVGPLFRVGGTSDLGEVARVLEEAGYLTHGTTDADGVAAGNQAADIIRAELARGGSTLRVGDADAIEAEARRRADEAMGEPEQDPWDSFSFTPDDLDESGYSGASDEVRAAVEQLLQQAESAGVDTETIREDVARALGADATDEAYHDAIKQALQQAIDQRRIGQADTGAAHAGGGNRGQAAEQAGGARGEGRQGRPDQEGLTLSAQTPDDLKAKSEREASARRADEAEQQRLERKARADAQRDEFTLTGSDRAADVAAAAGQRDIFGGATTAEVGVAQARIDRLRDALRKAEDKVLEAFPSSMAGGGDIEAAMKSRIVPASLKQARTEARDALRAAQAELNATPKAAPGWSAETHVKLVADSPAKLRADDVFRLFDELPKDAEKFDDLRAYIITARPDLMSAVMDAIDEVGMPRRVMAGRKTDAERTAQVATQHATANAVKQRLAAGDRFTISNPRRIITLTAPDQIKTGADGVYIAQGKKWVFLVADQVDQLAAQLPAQAAPMDAALAGAKDVAGMVDWLAKNSDSPGYRAIAQRISPLVGKVELIVVTSGKDVPGGVPTALNIAKGVFYENFKTGRRAVFIKDRSFKENGISEETLLHEAIHAATNEALRQGNLRKNAGTPLHAAVQELYDLQHKIVADLKARQAAGTLSAFEKQMHVQMAASDVREVLAWGLTDADFQTMLRGIRVDGRSGWSKFVAAVRKMLGLGSESNDALSELLAVSDKILAAQEGGDTITKTTDRVTEAVAPAADTNKKPAQATTKKPGEVDNFGQTLPPARRAMAAKLDEDLADGDIAARPLSEIWPLAENEAIEDTFAAAVAHAAREEIPAKPRQPYKVRNWVEKVKAMRSLAGHVVSGRLTRERLIDEVKGPRAGLRDWASKVFLLEQLPRDQWKRVGDVEERPDSVTYKNGTQVPMPTLRLSIDGKSHWLSGDAGVTGSAKGTIDGNRAAIMALLATDAPEARMQFEIRGLGPYKINKKGDSQYRPLMSFDSLVDARKAVKEDYNSLVAAWEAIKDRDNITEHDLRTAENRERAGQDWRGQMARSRVVQALVERSNADAKAIGGLLVREPGGAQRSGEGNVPGAFGLPVWPSAAGAVNPDVRKRPSYMAAVGLHLLRDLAKAESLSVQLRGKGNIPLVSAVQEAMLALGQDQQVLGSVVQRVPVDVVDFLAGKQLAPEALFRDKSVFKSLLPVQGGMPVGRSGDDPVLRLVRAVAGSGAESSVANDPARIALEGDSALMAGKVDSGLEQSLFSQDVSPEEFQAEFSFKGGEFGKWVAQGKGDKERQAMLNGAFDALMDLAQIVGVPPRAISLNGTLGIAFGSRGSGWASAHYEPSNLVINLTKTRGAGALAHEWFHALDNYFSRARRGGAEAPFTGNQTAYRDENFITHRPERMMVDKRGKWPPVSESRLQQLRKENPLSAAYNPANWMPDPKHPDGVRPEVERRFVDLVAALNASPMVKRARTLDGTKTGDGYWSRTLELAARAFESYVIARMQEDGYHNDFLVNVRKSEDVGKNPDRYPYLLPGEVKTIADAFGALFSEIKTRQDDAGNVAMFSLGANSARAAQAKARVQATTTKITEGWSNAPSVRVIGSMDEAPQEVRAAADERRDSGAAGSPEGFWHNGTVYLVAEQLPSDADVTRVLFHEALGHAGLRGVFGSSLNTVLDTFAQAMPVKVAAKAAEYGLDMRDLEQRRQAAEEALAEIAQTRPKLGSVQRLLAAIRTWLRENLPVLGIKMGDAEVLRNFIEPARGWVERGRAAATGGPVRFMVAYHGTPHRFDKFTTDKMGTGEGQQAFGWGLYFAGKKEIAEYYRKALSDTHLELNGEPLEAIAGMMGDHFPPVTAALLEHALNDGLGGAKAFVDHALLPTTSRRYLAAFGDDAVANATREELEAARDTLAEVREVSSGQLYEVDVPESSEMLLWDKPLSEQPEKVREALTRLLRANDLAGMIDSDRDGQSVYKSLGLALKGFGSKDDAKQKAASESLMAAGIKGIDYPAQSLSGGAKDGARNYVIFSGDDVAIKQTFFSLARDKQKAVAAQKALDEAESIGPDEWAAAADASFEAQQAFADKLASIPDDSFALSGERGGRMTMVNPSAQKPGQYQVTRFDTKGEPWSDAQHFTKRQAIDDFLQSVDLASVQDSGGAALGGARFSLGQSLAGAMNSAKDVALPAGYKVADLFNNGAGKLHWWHKSVGTMHNLAERNPLFKRVYVAAQTFINDVSWYATEAANEAPSILPKLETWRDLSKKPVSAADSKAMAAPVFEGTLLWARDADGVPVKVDELQARADAMSADDKARDLMRAGHLTPEVLRMWQGRPIEEFEAMVSNAYGREFLQPGVVWSDAELRRLFGLNAGQVKLYREFRAATDKSLTNLAISDMLRFAGEDAALVRQAVAEAGNLADAKAAVLGELDRLRNEEPDRADVLKDTAERIAGKVDQVQRLIDRGYAPLMRFGDLTLDVVDPTTGERLYFGMFEGRVERAMMKRKLEAEFPNAVFGEGTLSQEQHQLFQGMTPETLELFGDMLGLEAQGADTGSQLFQQYLKLAKDNRSAMKRLIHRKGVAGFSEDAGRVLASFVYSNARMTSRNLHQGELTRSAADIPKDQGELKDAALKLTSYVSNPSEEAAALKGMVFANFLGGSVASALVNATQPLVVAMPYLSQWGGMAKAAGRMKQAMADATKATTGDAALDEALAQASEKGIVSPQEVHQLMGQASGKATLSSGDGTKAGDALAAARNTLNRAVLAWGKVFSFAEQFNRKVTFIAAYRTAVAEGIADPAGFAEKAVDDTMFSYTKANRPRWARGFVGSLAFTFKTFAISYTELLVRMYKQGGPDGRRAALMSLAVLALAAGAQGLPGADDLDDLIDGALQRLGYNFSSKQRKREFLVNVLGEGGADFVLHGVSGLPGAPIDVSGRLGLGNIIPGTGLLTKKTDYTSDVTELAGPVASMVTNWFKAGGKAIEGDFGGAMLQALPSAAQNMAKAVDMMATGMYRDKKGRKVIDTDGYDALAKAIGFQPTDVKRVQEATGMVQQGIALNKMREAEIAEMWAEGRFEKDADKVREAMAMRDQWNRDNPESPIVVKDAQIIRRVREMSMSKVQRIEKTAPKEIKAQVKAELESVR